MISKIYHSKNLFINNGLYVVLSMLGAVFSYAIYPLLVRLLPAKSFGDFTVSLSITSQMASVFLAFNVVSLHLAKKHQNSNDLLEYLQSKIIRVFLYISLIIIVLLPILKSLLKMGSYVPLFATLLIMLLSIPVVVWLGYLQSHKEMTRVGVYTMLSALLKLIFTIMLAIILKNSIAIFGIVLAQTLAILALANLPGKKVPSIKLKQPTLSDEDLKKFSGIYRYLIISVIVTLVVSFVQNMDTLLGKYSLSDLQAGSFLSISSFSNVVFYIGFLFVWIVLSNLTIKNNKVDKIILFKALAVLCILTIISTIVCYILGGRLLSIINGSSKNTSVGQLTRNILYQSITAIISMYFYWSLALKRRRVLAEVLVYSVPFVTSALLFKYSSANAILNALLRSQLIGIIFVGLLIFTRYSFRISAHEKN